MHAHVGISPKSVRIVSIDRPFSGFKFIDDFYCGNRAARRCFSLARSFKARTMVVEDIDAAGIIQDENDEISRHYSGFSPANLQRISFWTSMFKTQRGYQSCESDDLVGYTILKQDFHPTIPLGFDGWHVFEAVFRKYDHKHNCIPNQGVYDVSVLGRPFQVKGILYCQQNGLNKVCAHVALRSLLSRLVPADPISYNDMNATASWAFVNGLQTQQIRSILDSYGIEYYDIDYNQAKLTSPSVREDLPYQKLVYSGIESGMGALLGFTLAGPGASPTTGHIIPFYGHTFNKDTWAPEAHVAYFNVGANLGFVPSASWTSSFIGHDDNFGMNFCVPRLYIDRQQVSYAMEILRSNALYGGFVAEAMASSYIYSLYSLLDQSNYWTARLAEYAHPGEHRVILRAVCVNKSEYLSHLSGIKDWEGNTEAPSVVISELQKLRADLLWVVEVSIPQLFPANERKLGEIVLDAQQKHTHLISGGFDFSSFIIARFPGAYILLPAVNQHGPAFIKVPSAIQSHVPVLRLP